MQFFEPSAFTGIVLSSTLLANLNGKSFERLMRRRSVKYWLLLGALLVLPVLISIYTINVIFK